ncbi:choice-of-anchor A family protein [Streptomyces sp. VRA16 Mangrove soil]|uniref:choice-of-anchor A family protein n=1 Tax=Streptomyces sp. VRA16 Mangrove soil TaxID=2817434 RepID=UPI001A9F7169|nr:choice-of-anchor A family protein [Streptomyces sp. VRA16 Mangrove soil]MBO1334626.1 choice-of-anchor A family protein [Streptomyces sp. VRA16 Mangrove soil]
MTRTTRTPLAVAATASLACTAGLGLALPGTAAGAGALRDTVTIGNPVAGSNGFGVVTEADATLGSTESEGPVAVGGNLRFGDGYNVALNDTGSYVAPGDSQPIALLVGGRVDYAGSSPVGVLRVLRDGYVKIGDMTGGQALTTDQNGAFVDTRVDTTGSAYDSTPRIELTTRESAAAVAQSGLMDFPALFTTYRERAQRMNRCATNVVLRDGNGTPLGDQDAVPANANLKITLTEGVTNVLHITGANLNDIADLTFTNQPSASTPLVVVVDTSAEGGDYTWRTPTLAGVGGAQAPYMLWDFPDATKITIADGDTLEGTLFAPSADVTDLDPANMEGDVIVKSLVAGPLTASGSTDVNAGEIHYFPFAAELECSDKKPANATLTPAPSSSSVTPTTTATPTPTPTPTPTATPTPTGSLSPSPTPTPTLTPAPTPAPSTSPAATPSSQPSPTGPELANTGAGRRTGLLGVIAVGAIGTGSAALIWARRRRTR